MSYKIITDSCCDFTDQMCEAMEISCVPLIVSYNGESHTNFSEEEAIKAFYNELRNGVTATTSAVNPEGWAELMKPVLDQGQDVLTICFSSGLSTTYQSAVIAAEELKENYPDRKRRSGPGSADLVRLQEEGRRSEPGGAGRLGRGE